MSGAEVIALAGIGLSFFLGYLSYRTAKDGRDDAHKLATESRAAASDDARATRLFDARREVYVDVMDYVYRIETYVSRTEPIMSSVNDPPPPTFPPEEEQRRQSAAIAAFGSPAIRAKLMEFKVAGNDFQGSVWVLHGQREHFGQHSNEALQEWKVVQEKREAMKAMVLELIELVNADLAR